MTFDREREVCGECELVCVKINVMEKGAGKCGNNRKINKWGI